MNEESRYSEYKEKAEKYDLIINLEPHGSALDTMALKIKQLKEEAQAQGIITNLQNEKESQYQENYNLKKQVERELKDNNGLRVTVGKYLNLKQQIQEYLDAEVIPDYGYPWHIAITKILKDR